MSNATYADKEKKFKELLENWPKAGDELTGLNGRLIEVHVEKVVDRSTQEPHYTMYTHAVIDNECTGWFLDYDPRGVICLIDPDSHEKILSMGFPEVKKLRVLRKNQKGTALICEVIE